MRRWSAVTYQFDYNGRQLHAEGSKVRILQKKNCIVFSRVLR